jgi:hypothetical protein
VLLALNEAESLGLRGVVDDYRLCDLCRTVTYEAINKAVAEGGSFQHHTDTRVLIQEAVENDPPCRLFLMIFLALDKVNKSLVKSIERSGKSEPWAVRLCTWERHELSVVIEYGF